MNRDPAEQLVQEIVQNELKQLLQTYRDDTPVERAARIRMMVKEEVAEYQRRVAQLLAASPGVALTSDVICGFPGETDADHALNLQLLQRVPFDNLFSFIFSGAVGVWLYARHGSIEWRSATWLAAGAAPGAFLGAVLAARTSGQILLILVGATVVFAGWRVLRRPRRQRCLFRLRCNR